MCICTKLNLRDGVSCMPAALLFLCGSQAFLECAAMTNVCGIEVVFRHTTVNDPNRLVLFCPFYCIPVLLV